MEAAIVERNFRERWGEFPRQLWEPRGGWAEVGSQGSPCACCPSRCLPASLEKREAAGPVPQQTWARRVRHGAGRLARQARFAGQGER